MKKILVSIVIIMVVNTVFAQENWFTTYSDSKTFMNDANRIKDQFVADIKDIQPDSKLNLHLVLNTTPSFIFIYRDTVHLSLWEELIPEQKHYLSLISGGEEEGKEVFGLFFNGFYLPHELAHGFQFSVEKKSDLREYDMEFYANTVAMLWWKKQHREAELERCYNFAKTMMKDYPDPFPAGVDWKDYFSENYDRIINDMELFSRIYPYVQFTQFIEIYEDKNLPEFDTYIKNYLVSRNAAKLKP
jgi:hypothetical protein